MGEGCATGREGKRWATVALLGGGGRIARRETGGLLGCAAGQERGGGQRLRCWVGGGRIARRETGGLLGGRRGLCCGAGGREVGDGCAAGWKGQDC